MALKQKVSLEDYLAMPEEKPYREYLYGEVVEKAMPKDPHAAVQTTLSGELRSWGKPLGGKTRTELRCILRTPTDIHVQLPDVAWFRALRLDNGNAVSPPVLAVEILSPDDRFARVQQKIQVYLQAGVTVVWVVDPEAQTVSVYRPDQAPVLLEGDAVLEDPALPGLRLPLSLVFEDVQNTGERT